MAELDNSGKIYLGILELEDILHREMKVNISEAYKKRTKMFNSNLNVKDLITAMNIWVLAAFGYYAYILKWKYQNLKDEKVYYVAWGAYTLKQSWTSSI